MRRVPENAPRLVIGLILLGIAGLFAAQLVAIVSHRLDYPVVDDWSYYRQAQTMPMEFSLRWLFFPALDTLHVSGKLLDWLYFRGVAHDYRGLAITSFALAFGGWLVCAVLFCIALGRDRPAVLVSSLLAFVVPLASMPYWVASSPGQWLEPAIAYHQMLPVLGLFLLSLIGVSRWGRTQRTPVITLVAVLTATFSLVYSSGAVSMGVLGITVGALSLIDRRRTGGKGGPLLVFAATVAAVAGACLVAHVALPIVVHDRNPITETWTNTPTLPTNPIFWHFFVGLFDRATLSTEIGVISALRGALNAALVLLPLALLPVLVWKQKFSGEERDRLFFLLGIVCAVACYAALVSYGRADFGDRYFPEKHAPRVNSSLYAHTRFFYWWISAILPLTILAWGLVVEKAHSRRAAGAIAAVLLLLAIFPKAQNQRHGEFSYLDHWRYSTLYARDAAKLTQFIHRDQRPYFFSPAIAYGKKWMSLDKTRRNKLFRPGDRNWMPGNERYLYRVAASSDANFVRRWGLLRRKPTALGEHRPKPKANGEPQQPQAE